MSRPQINRYRLAAGALFASLVCASASAQTPSPNQPQTATRFSVQSVRVQGNTLLPETELQAVVARWIGEDRTLGDLKQAAAAVQKRYRKAGYGGVVAYVPEQAMQNGQVVIQVVEGKLARVKIAGNTRYDEAQIRSSLPNLRLGETPLIPAIDRDIQLANENPAKELQVRLSAGEGPGEVAADIQVVEKNPLRFFVTLDNTGNSPTGEERVSVGVQHANLWNLDHIGTLQYQTSPTEPELVHVYSVGYRIPLYGYSASVDAFYAHSSVENGATLTPAGPLQFTGRGNIAGLRTDRYLARLGEYDHRVTLGLDRRAYENECSVGELGPAGCGTAAASVTVLPLSIAYTGQVQTPEVSWGTSTTLSHNVGGSNSAQFEAARPGAEKKYTVLRFSGFYSRNFSSGFGVQARAYGQYSGDALVPGEQIGLGGAASVRGYREREIAGDYGTIVNLEGLGPDFGAVTGFDQTSLRALVFADYGHAANHKSAPCRGTESRCSLASVGIGARLTLGKNISARVEVGHALKDSTQTSSDSTRAHFAVNLVF